MGVAEARDPGALEDMSKKEECGRKLVVGMRLTASSREMLTWTIAKIARPGDHILALHVSTSPISGSSTTKTPLHSTATSLSLHVIFFFFLLFCPWRALALGQLQLHSYLYLLEQNLPSSSAKSPIEDFVARCC
jgi:hypothetical protein